MGDLLCTRHCCILTQESSTLQTNFVNWRRGCRLIEKGYRVLH
jgi:hypothetical protein